MCLSLKRRTGRHWREDGGAGDEARVVGGQEHHAARDFLGLARAPGRGLRNDAFGQDLLVDGAHHLGADVAGRIAFTVMPARAPSCASALVKPRSPDLAAE